MCALPGALSLSLHSPHWLLPFLGGELSWAPFYSRFSTLRRVAVFSEQRRPTPPMASASSAPEPHPSTTAHRRYNPLAVKGNAVNCVRCMHGSMGYRQACVLRRCLRVASSVPSLGGRRRQNPLVHAFRRRGEQSSKRAATDGLGDARCAVLWRARLPGNWPGMGSSGLAFFGSLLKRGAGSSTACLEAVL